MCIYEVNPMLDFFRSQDVYHLLGFFIIYSVAGWIWESCYCSIKKKKLINRGFLNGPVIPVVYLIMYGENSVLQLIFQGKTERVRIDSLSLL